MDNSPKWVGSDFSYRLGRVTQAWGALELVPAIFYQFFVRSSNDSPSKTMKNVFHFI